VFGQGISGRDLILFFGGLFLLWKSSQEMYHALEGEDESDDSPGGKGGNFLYTIIQIAIIDIVFSLDSVITAIGMVNEIVVMVAAIILAVAVMIFASNPVGDFIDRHPTLRMLALAFLILVGVVLIADGLQFHIPRGYVYFAMGFSIAVEALNLWARKRAGRS
jgi:predicted tellurium resistance membrane protein TerC